MVALHSGRLMDIGVQGAVAAAMVFSLMRNTKNSLVVIENDVKWGSHLIPLLGPQTHVFFLMETLQHGVFNLMCPNGWHFIFSEDCL